jgi:hypothetical protein
MYPKCKFELQIRKNEANNLNDRKDPSFKDWSWNILIAILYYLNQNKKNDSKLTSSLFINLMT